MDEDSCALIGRSFLIFFCLNEIWEKTEYFCEHLFSRISRSMEFMKFSRPFIFANFSKIQNSQDLMIAKINDLENLCPEGILNLVGFFDKFVLPYSY